MSNPERYERSRDVRGMDDRAQDDRERDDRAEDRDRGDRRRGPICFNCNEIGHYGNQCPRPRRYGGMARPSTSTDSLRSRSPRRGDWRREPAAQLDRGVTQQISELGRSVAAMKQHFEEEWMREENRLRRKQEKEEEKRREEEMRIREEEERVIQEKKARKKKERRRKEAESRTELKKDLSMQMVMQLSELEDKFGHRMKQAITGTGKLPNEKGKEVKRGPACSGSGSESEASITQDLSARTTDLVISEKRKRGPDRVIGNSPPMESPAKRTPKSRRKQATFTRRLTRARAKMVKSPGSAKRKTPVRTPLLARKKKVTPLDTGIGTPDLKGSLARYKYRNIMMQELKLLDASELQRICREEGVPYDGKVDEIFDITDHRTYLKLEIEEVPELQPEAINIEDSEVVGPNEGSDAINKWDLRVPQLWVVC
ncbi:hypothetical protein CBR_g38700 [Chara braunii]|uniref:CCHC-type domain-containing protein n=1 Tax=Chara braunii TaxID=69332 RepID=A0A388LQ07_CHABU|nr:hypothetical protein CBR_g38700 [Chara braunii]|eukprot:GBG84416.1 hypothetical protein CBR_g38700 [Chara braunii]